MNRAGKLSIVVAVYNIEAQLDRCVRSLVAQNYPELEIILVDDGSTDASGTKCDAWAQRDDRIHAYHKSNGGLSDARNYGLSKADGAYVWFVDGDDYICENACAALMATADQFHSDIVLGDAKATFSDNKTVKLTDFVACYRPYTGKELLYISIKNYVYYATVWRMIYRVAFLREHALQFRKGIYHEDEEFTPRAYLLAQQIVVIPDCVYMHENDRPTSITNAPQLVSKRAQDCIDIIEAFTPLFKAQSPRKLRRVLLDFLCRRYMRYVEKFHLTETDSFHVKRWYPLLLAGRKASFLKALVFAVSPKAYRKLARKYDLS